MRMEWWSPADVVTLSLTSWEQSGQGGVVNAVATSPDGNWIASGSDDDTVKLWHAGGGTFARTLAANSPFPVTALAFSHDSTILAAGYTDGSIRLWNPANGALVRTINLYWGGKTNNLGKIASLSFSPDGQYLAAGSGDLYTRIWKVSDGTMNQAWVKNAGPVQSVAYSPDGTMLATGSQDKTDQVLHQRLGQRFRGSHDLGFQRHARGLFTRWHRSGCGLPGRDDYFLADGQLFQLQCAH